MYYFPLVFNIRGGDENIREEIYFILILTFGPYMVQKNNNTLNKVPYLLRPQLSSLGNAGDRISKILCSLEVLWSSIELGSTL